MCTDHMPEDFDYQKAICDMCEKKCNIGDIGNHISVFFPYGHELDASHGRLVDDPHEFCSSDCLIDYIVLNQFTPPDIREKLDRNFADEG